VERKA